MTKKAPKIAIVADWLTNYGGAERVIQALAKAYPEAPIYTLVYNEDLFPNLKGRLRGTFLQQLPKKLRKKHQYLLPFYPIAFESLDLSQYDVIISSSSAFAKSVKTTKNQTHICYCHSPVRYLYHAREQYIKDYPLPWWARPAKLILPAVLWYLKKKDQKAAKNVTHFVSNSDYIGKRIQKYYNQKSTTIYPCIDTNPFIKEGNKKIKSVQIKQKEPDATVKSSNKDSKADAGSASYFFAVGRFIPYKKFDDIVTAFTRLPYTVKLAGIGPELERCKSIAKKANATNIEFLGFVPDESLPGLYAGARAFLFPAEEDFGLTPVEAMASGTPVIHYDAGGATESVPDLAGIHYTPQTPDGLIFAIESFIKKEKNFNKEAIQAHAQKFDQERFIDEIKAFIAKKTK